jgi:hypothetical protein
MNAFQDLWSSLLSVLTGRGQYGAADVNSGVRNMAGACCAKFGTSIINAEYVEENCIEAKVF